MDILRIFYVLILGISSLEFGCSEEEKVCQGSNLRYTATGSAESRYNHLKNTYENCTFVNGNLEITHLDGQDNYDLSFLSTIKEVTGYVLIYAVYADYVPLTNLRVIRGATEFKPDSKSPQFYSLYIADNFKPGSSSVGLKELRFTSLYEIMESSVMIFNNHHLCFANTIDWEDILNGERSRFIFHNDNRTYVPSRECGQCHEDCEGSYRNDQGAMETVRHCWGAGPDMCQKLTKRTCSAQCYSRCFGEFPDKCCSAECAGGCSGPTAKECWACKNFKNGDECVAFCPRQLLYDPQQFKYVPNPKAKFAYGTLCVNECPEHLVVKDQGCVISCGDGKRANPTTKVCEDCDGPCPKTCKGIPPGEWVTSKNIADLKNCTVIDGSISIMKNTFDGDEHFNIAPLHPSNLSIFETVKEVTGFVKIQGEHPEFTSLSFLKNLTTIHGRELDNRHSVSIVRTFLESLDMANLQHISRGNILVYSNKHLCYVRNITWPVLNGQEQTKTIVRNKDYAECLAEGLVCSDQCSSDGCWGKGDYQCLSCKNFKLDERCVQSCDEHPNTYQNGTSCHHCDVQCLDGCTGPGADQCHTCRNFQDGPRCTSECPTEKFPDENKMCQPCHSHCSQYMGCTGPRNIIGEGGCNKCDVIELDTYGNLVQCLPDDLRDNCEEGYFSTRSREYKGIPVCQVCHELCTLCYGHGVSNCEACTYFREDKNCVSNCSSDYYPINGTCFKCDGRCATCYGPTNADCYTCKQYKLPIPVQEHTKSEEVQTFFNCTDSCPTWAPLKQIEYAEDGKTVLETACVTEAEAGHSGDPKKLRAILGAVVGTIVLLCVVVSIVAYLCSKRARALESKERLAAHMSGMCEESEVTPLTPSAAKPDMAILRLIKENQLRKGTMVGSGAFGTVYKGFWIPEGENIKIPVAIKVLQEGTSANQNRELLEEARVMASVNNRYCVPVIGVCMTAQIMLVTPYMPLGCLLDYVRKNQENIGSKALLDWSTQIASGMSYLEEKGIVHRDLAARNVLVQNPKRVRVTDFGLAKLLDYNQEEFHATGGKMPIKWLALECMQYRIFTHKSDVWSFGVTMWELFTYGQRPYENIRARDIPELLEKGERLPQPPICTIDVYMIMIKCWMLDAQSRPSFKELAEEFAKMAQDPGRYLVIQGDRLMRLPSHSYDKQVFRNMSVSGDGPEEIVEAEDYLMPSSDDIVGESLSPPHRHHSHHRSHHNHHHPNGKILGSIKEDNSGSYDNERSRNGRDELDSAIPVGSDAPIKYSSLEARAAELKQRAETSPARDSLASRYSSDPCRALASPPQCSPLAEEDIPQEPAPPTPIDKQSFHLHPANKRGSGAEKSKHQQLPVDEDDYLQPSHTSHPKYMDLVTDDYLPPSPSRKDRDFDSELDLPPPPPDPPGYLPNNINMFAENPEYFDQINSGSDMPSESQPLTGGNPAEKDRLRSMSSESEGANSENDYYNDTAHLSKVRQPKKGAFVTNSRTNNPSVKYVV